MKTSSFLGKLDRNLAIVGLLLCIFLGPVLYYFNQVRSLLLLGYISFSLIIYLVIYKKLLMSRVSLLPDKTNSLKTTLIINILYFFSISIIILSYVLRENVYQRPLVHFIAIAVAASLLVIDAYYCPNFKWYEYYVLIKIIFFGLLIRWLLLDLFPAHFGFDAWTHEKIVEDMLLVSRIPDTLPTYSRLPGMHLFFGASMLITGLSFKLSQMYIVVVAQEVVYSIITYLFVARFISGRRVALLSALFVSIANITILNSLWTYPNGFVLVIGIVIIYGVILARYIPSKRINFIVYLLIFVSIITHTAGPFGVAVVLVCFWLASKFYKKIYGLQGKDIEMSKGLNITFSIFFVTMLSWWIYASGHLAVLVKIVRWAFDIEKFLIAFTPKNGELYTESLPILELFLNQVGFSVFFSLSIIGSLYFISRKSIGRLLGFLLAVSGQFIAVLGLGGMALQVHVLPERWLYLAQIILSVPAAFGCVLFVGLVKKRIRWVPVMVVSTMMAFFMITNSLVNYDNPILAPSKTTRDTFTKGEIVSMQTIGDRWDGVIASDQQVFFFYFLRRKSGLVIINEHLDSRDFSSLKDSVVLIRDYITTNPIAAGGLAWKLDFDLIMLLEQQQYMQIYDSGNVKLFKYFMKE